MEKCFSPKATGNRQQATGNRQQATGNYTYRLNNRVNYLTVTLAALAATPTERLREAETIIAYIFSPVFIHSPNSIFSHFGNKRVCVYIWSLCGKLPILIERSFI
jgi:hypothetical protein